MLNPQFQRGMELDVADTRVSGRKQGEVRHITRRSQAWGQADEAEAPDVLPTELFTPCAVIPARKGQPGITNTPAALA